MPTRLHLLLLTTTALAAAAAPLDAQERRAPVLQTMRRLYTGPRVRSWNDLKAYTGREAANCIVGDLRRKAFLFNYEQLAVNYGEGVDFQLRREQAILCPQTADFLYSKFTPTRVSYQKGSRPVLEKVAAAATKGCKTEQAKALALMRFCRDLYQKRKTKDFIYGGTEEQLIEKGEILCECLGRLFAALCEVSGIPARIVMHDIGGHICSEAYVGGHWGYLDPTTGIYFLKPNGWLASTWEIWQDPSLLRAQSKRVKADVTKRFTWEQRVWKCEHMYFHPKEVNGFENYRLADAGRYRYFQLSDDEVRRAGLFRINPAYVETSKAVFGLENDVSRYFWPRRKLRTIPLAYRNDGFSQWYRKPPMTRRTVEKRLVDPFKDSHVSILAWGLGPGSVFCFDTKVGEVFGAGLTPEQWKLMRQGDRWVHENVTRLIRAGHDPLRIAIERGHELGIKVFARLEMNHEYGPAKPDNWLWVGFVGSFNKQHPEYRIPGRVLLDFKHQAVRGFKLAVLREAAEAGADGLALDFAVYPPFFEKPQPKVMTQFVRDVRAMLDEVGRAQKRKLALMVRVPFRAADIGLDWQTWMKEKLVDILVPTHMMATEAFDIPVEEFVSLGRQTGCKVFGCIWHSLGFVCTDPDPSGKQRYDKPKTKGMFYAQALLFHRAGVDGIQIAMSADEWNRRRWYDDLADPAKVEFAGKHYMVDPGPYLPVRFDFPAGAGRHTSTRLAMLRIGDDVERARAAGYKVTTTLVANVRPLKPGEQIQIFINGQGPATLAGAASKPGAGQAPVDVRKQPRKAFVFDREWWRRGQHRIRTDPAWWRLGANTIRFVYTRGASVHTGPPAITWVDLLINYRRPSR